VLLRHGRTEWNGSHRFQGHTDVPLDAGGLQQADRAAALLAPLAPARVVSSDLARAVSTAEPLARRLGLDLATDPALRETHAGSWEGRFDSDLAADPDYQAWRLGADVPAGGSETRSQVADRATPALLSWAEDLDPSSVLVVVTHGGTVRCVIGRLLDLPVDRWRALGGLANGCWSVLEQGATGWRLAEHNAGSLPEPVLGDDR
jgi:probable phosphoglycerate mutase